MGRFCLGAIPTTWFALALPTLIPNYPSRSALIVGDVQQSKTLQNLGTGGHRAPCRTAAGLRANDRFRRDRTFKRRARNGISRVGSCRNRIQRSAET